MRPGGGTVFCMAVHYHGPEALYISAGHRIRFLFSSSPGGSRFLFLAAAQKMKRSYRGKNWQVKKGHNLLGQVSGVNARD